MGPRNVERSLSCGIRYSYSSFALIIQLQDVRLSVGDSLYIMVSGMEDCWADNGAWHLLNSIFCVEPISKLFIIESLILHLYYLSLAGVWSIWGSWSSCNLKTGKKQRTRQCSNPTSSSETPKCAGSNKDETTCQG